MAAATRKVTMNQCLSGCVLLILFLGSHGLNLDCIEVKMELKAQGGSENEVPIQAISGEHLEVCSQGYTCCTRDMEQKLRSLSAKKYDKVVEETFRYVKSTFVTRTRKFDEFFTELLAKAKSDLHEMFVKTYGLLYQQHSDIFANLFKEFQKYYKGTDLSLREALDNFFRNLLRKMFSLLNPSRTFNDAYLKCVTNQMNSLKPFGDVPQKLSLQVKRSFVAARTFVQGLTVGREVILEVLKIPPTEACTKALMKMTYCPHCRGLTQTKPCNNYCLNTMKGCLAYHAELNDLWNEYIEAMKQLAIRLEGPFNIESVVDPIDVQISEAIMTLHDNGENVSERIFQGCGGSHTTNLGRAKRETGMDKNKGKFHVHLNTTVSKPVVTNMGNVNIDKNAFLAKWQNSKLTPGGSRKNHSSHEEFDHGRYSPPTKKRKKGGNNWSGPNKGSKTLERLVKDIKEKVKHAKDYWVQLPYAVCNKEEIAAQPGNEEDCWNGQDRAKYGHEVQKDGIINQINNPEVEVDVNAANNIIEQQKINLKLITSRLYTAYHGDEVKWIPILPETDYIDGSGMGSGDGFDEGSGDGSGDTGSGSGDGWDGDDEEERPSKGKGNRHNKGGKKKFTVDNDHYFGQGNGMGNKNTNVVGLEDRTRHVPQNPSQQPDSAAVQAVSMSFTCLFILITGLRTVLHILV